MIATNIKGRLVTMSNQSDENIKNFSYVVEDTKELVVVDARLLEVLKPLATTMSLNDVKESLKNYIDISKDFDQLKKNISMELFKLSFSEMLTNKFALTDAPVKTKKEVPYGPNYKAD
jgi:hypothetical protein